MKLKVYGKEVPSREPKPQFLDRGMVDMLQTKERLCVSEGVDAFFNGKVGKATELLLQALNMNYWNPEAAFYMGIICKSQGANTAAISYISRTISVQPENAEARMERGRMILEKGSGLVSDALAAMHDFEVALALGRKDAQYYIGCCRHKMMDYKEALAAFEAYCNEVPVDIGAAQMLEIYRYKTKYLLHYVDLLMQYGSARYN